MKKMTYQQQIDWLLDKIISYDTYASLKDETYLEDIKRDIVYAFDFFDISDVYKKIYKKYVDGIRQELSELSKIKREE